MSYTEDVQDIVQDTVAAESPEETAVRETLAAMSDLRRRKLFRLFQVLDADRTGEISYFTTGRLHDRYAELAARGRAEEHAAQLGETVRRLWHQFEQDGPGEDPLCDREKFAYDFACRLEDDPDRIIRMVGLITNVVFALADQDADGELHKEDALRLGTEFMSLSAEEAEAVWLKLAPAGKRTLSYAECLKLVTDFVVGEDPTAPGNWFFGPF